MLNRRSFIASITAAGLLPFMPKPVRAWADGLYLPAGTKLTGFQGQLIATVKTDQWTGGVIAADSFQWVSKPSAGSIIPFEFLWSAANARQRLGMDLSEDDKGFLRAKEVLFQTEI